MSVDVPVRPAPPWRRAVGAGSTTPERLRRVTAVLVVGCLASALVSVLGGVARTSSVQDARTRISALTADSAELYQSLADADAMATSGYVSGGLEPTAVRARYDDDIRAGQDGSSTPPGLLPPGDPAIATVATVGEQLPVYTGLVENARTLNRAGAAARPVLPRPARRSSCGPRSCPPSTSCAGTQSAELAAAYRRGAAIPFAVLCPAASLCSAIVDLACASAAAPTGWSTSA